MNNFKKKIGLLVSILFIGTICPIPNSNSDQIISSNKVYAATLPSKNPTSLSLNKTSDTLKVGETDALITSLVIPGNANNNAIDNAVKWTSSNADIATVNNGVIAGISVGTTIIAATLGNKTASCTVTVVHNPMITGTVKNPDGTLATSGFVDIIFLNGGTGDFINVNNGTFVIDSLADGVYTLTAYPAENSEFANSATKTITIVNGAVSPSSDAKIELVFTNPQITGTVKNPDGTLATSGFVSISPQNSGMILGTLINNGRFVVGALTDGVYNIWANDNGNNPYCNSFTKTITILDGAVSPSSDANIELYFTKPQITVTVKNPDGTLATSGGVIIAPQNEGMSFGFSINEGKVLFGGLADGVYNIWATTNGNNQYRDSITKVIIIENGAVSPVSDANIELYFTYP